MFVYFFLYLTFSYLLDCGFSGQSQTVIASEFYNSVTSPNYPLDYGNGLECKLLINVDSSLSLHGYILKVIFSDFQLGSCTGFGDTLKFYDGINAVSSLLGSYCGTTHPDVIFSTGQYLYVKFYTGSFTTNKGFNFSFSAVKEGMFSYSLFTTAVLFLKTFRMSL